MSTYEELRAKAIKRCRREILAALAIMYAIGPFGFPEICRALLHLELPDELPVRDDLVYLCDKGYVRWTNEGPMVPWNQRLYRLTAAGKEIVDRIHVDPTLEP